MIVSLPGFASFTTAAIAIAALAAACSSSSSSGKDGKPSPQGDASTSCALVGCAAPPPCGQGCTAPCGCCPNYECNEAGPAADASDTCDEALLEWAPDAGVACEEWVSANCCAEQSACANDPACKATVECVNACGADGPNDCVAACPEDTSGRLEPLASCTKKTPDGGSSIPTSCKWP